MSTSIGFSVFALSAEIVKEVVAKVKDKKDDSKTFENKTLVISIDYKEEP